MMAILRYAFLKNMRDGSLAAFILGPVIMIVAPLLGVSIVEKRGIVYPLSMNPHWTGVKTAAEVVPITLTVLALFGALAGFWAFRGEIVTRSIGSFVLAVRPIRVQIAAAIFGASAGLAGFLATSVLLFGLIGSIPPHPLRVVADATILCLCAASAGSLVVIIQSEPWAILIVYVSGLFLLPWLMTSRGILPEAGGLMLAAVCVAVSAFFLERRCAT
jgi:hypothetical protein